MKCSASLVFERALVAHQARRCDRRGDGGGPAADAGDGRATCSGTRALVERTLAKEELEEFTREKFALVAADADALEPRAREIFDALPIKAPTPVIAYLAAEGRLLASTAGGSPPAVLLNDMLRSDDEEVARGRRCKSWC